MEMSLHYHHGENSLNSTIVGLAQNFPGSNNINTLVPQGQFGTRLQGGKDAASPRYIFTRLAHIARSLFHRLGGAQFFRRFLDENRRTIDGHTIAIAFTKTDQANTSIPS